MTPPVTKIGPSETEQHSKRKGFVPVANYWNIPPMRKEIGGIFRHIGPMKIVQLGGAYLETNLQCVERIVVS